MSQENVEQVTEAVKNVSVSGGSQRPPKAEKPAKQAPPPPAEDHAKDRYGKVPVNFGRMTHTGTTLVSLSS